VETTSLMYASVTHVRQYTHHKTSLKSQCHTAHTSKVSVTQHTPQQSVSHSTHLNSQCHTAHTSTVSVTWHTPQQSVSHGTHLNSQCHTARTHHVYESEPLTHSQTQWCYGPLRGWTPLITHAHSSLSTALWHHLLTFISPHILFNIFHLNLSLPILLLPSCFLSNIFLTTLPRSILTSRPIHSDLSYLTPPLLYLNLYAVSTVPDYSLFYH